MSPRDYHVSIRLLTPEEGTGFLASVPGLPNCRSDSDTPEEVLANVYDATACWIEAAEEMGHAIPQPRRVAA